MYSYFGDTTLGASGYHYQDPEPGQPERRSPDRQELVPRAHRAELEFGAPVVEDAPRTYVPPR